MPPLTIGFSEAKARLSQVTEEVHRTGQSVLVFKNNKPWVTISPVTDQTTSAYSQNSFGSLNEYANPDLKAQEEDAWRQDAAENHAVR